MSISRRHFLTTGAASAAVVSGVSHVPQLLLQAAAANALAGQATSDRILIVLQLTGGNDGLNTVVPYADDLYGRNRFQTRLGPGAVHKIDSYLGLHPSAEGLHRLYQEGDVAIVQGVGYEHPNRSHFESMDIWHTAQAQAAPEATRPTGWLGRYLDAHRRVARAEAASDVPAVHLGSEVQPLALAGLEVHAPSIGALDQFRFDRRGGSQLAALRERVLTTDHPHDDPRIKHLREAARSALAASRRIQTAVGQGRAADNYPSSGLGKKLHGVAQLIKAGLSTRLYYVTLDGFDTHSLQAEAHAGLLRELSGAIAALQSDLKQAGRDKQVLLVCFSEFGRRVKENASRGTDHGAAAPMLVVGSQVRGGLIGEHPRLDELEDGDLRYHTDFRSVYATILDDWLNVASEPILGRQFPKLALLE